MWYAMRKQILREEKNRLMGYNFVSLRSWTGILNRLMNGWIKPNQENLPTLWISGSYRWQWFDCHLNQNHLGHILGCPELATVVVWPPGPSWHGADPESPFLLSLGKSGHHLAIRLGLQSWLLKRMTYSNICGMVYLKLSFYFVPVMFKSGSPLHSLVLCFKCTLFLSKNLLVGLLQSLLSYWEQWMPTQELSQHPQT